MIREQEAILALEEAIGYHFKNKALVKEALTHSSYANERKINKIACNERLEFLGDAVLQLISSDYLFHLFPDSPEGQLSKTRSSLVCEPTLSSNAKELGLDRLVFLGKGEEAGGGREKASVTSDAFEALIGAIYLDGGLAEAKRFIDLFALKDAVKHKDDIDPKSALQQEIQKGGKQLDIVYEVIHESGPEHEKRFVVQVKINGIVSGTGEGSNKKNAEKAAAKEALSKLRK